MQDPFVAALGTTFTVIPSAARDPASYNLARERCRRQRCLFFGGIYLAAFQRSFVTTSRNIKEAEHHL